MLGDVSGKLFTWDTLKRDAKPRKLDVCTRPTAITTLAVVRFAGTDDVLAAMGCTNGQITIVNCMENSVLGVVQHAHKADIHSLKWATECVVVGGGGGTDSYYSRHRLNGDTLPLNFLLSTAPGEALRVYEFRATASPHCIAISVPPLPLPLHTDTDTGDDFNCIETELALVAEVPPLWHNEQQSNQRQRTWVAADWVRVDDRGRVGVGSFGDGMCAWVVVSAYSGSMVAVRISMLASNGTTNPVEEDGVVDQRSLHRKPPPAYWVRLPSKHNRSIFSIFSGCSDSCSGIGYCDLRANNDNDDNNGDKNERSSTMYLVTTGMDRTAMTYSTPLLSSFSPPFVRRQPHEEKQTVAVAAAAMEGKDKKIWQSMKCIGICPCLGAFPHAISAMTMTTASSTDSDFITRLAIGCGDNCIRLVSLPLLGSKHSIFKSTDGTDGTDEFALDANSVDVVWQGIPCAVTAIAWHPHARSIVAFGCADGSVGLAHVGKKTAVVAPAKHQSSVKAVAWMDGGDGTQDGNNVSANTSSSLMLLSLSSEQGGMYVWPDFNLIIPERGEGEAFFPNPSAAFLPSSSSSSLGHPHGQFVKVQQTLGHPLPIKIRIASNDTNDSSSNDIETTVGVLGSSSPSRIVVGRANGVMALLAPFSERETSNMTDSTQGVHVTQHIVHIPCTSATEEEGTKNNLEVVLAAPFRDGSTDIVHRNGQYTLVRSDCTVAFEYKFECRRAERENGGSRNKSGAVEVISHHHANEVTVAAAVEVHGMRAIAVGMRDGRLQVLCLGCTDSGSDGDGDNKLEGGGNEPVLSAPPQQANKKNVVVTLTPPHAGPVCCLEWIGAGQDESSVGLVSGSEDQSLKFWNVSGILSSDGIGDRDLGGMCTIFDVDNGLIEKKKEEETEEETTSPLPSSTVGVFVVDNADTGADAVVAALDTSGAKETVVVKHVAHALSPSGAGTKQPSFFSYSTTMLGAKALLPPQPQKELTAQDQRDLQRALLTLSSLHTPPSHQELTRPPEGATEEDFLATLGCIVPGNAIQAKDCLKNAAEALLSSSSTTTTMTSMTLRLQAQRAATLLLWSGEVHTALKILLENDAMTGDFVSSTAAWGRGPWEAAARAYASFLESKGEFHTAVLHLTSVGDKEAACRLYMRAGMGREAALLASTTLPPRHPTAIAARSAYASALEGRGEYERAAAQRLVHGDVKGALGALQRRGTVDAVRAAIAVLRNSQEDLDGLDVVMEMDVLEKELEGLVHEDNDSGSGGDALAKPDPTEKVVERKKRRYSVSELESIRTATTSDGKNLLRRHLPQDLLLSSGW